MLTFGRTSGILIPVSYTHLGDQVHIYDAGAEHVPTEENLVGLCGETCAVSYTHLVEAVKKANSIGAITIAMTGNMDTGMAKVGQYVVTYSNGDDQVYSCLLYTSSLARRSPTFS